MNPMNNERTLADTVPRQPLAERVKAGLREGIEAARGERELVETVVEIPDSSEFVKDVWPDPLQTGK